MARKVIEQQYIYKAEVDRVVDGDTVDVLLDLSFGVYRKVRIRVTHKKQGRESIGAGCKETNEGVMW